MTYRILTLDGGGVRGMFTATLLSRLQEAARARGRDFLGDIDLFAGTSTGAVLALGLAKGLSPESLAGLYRDHAREVFQTSLVREITSVHGLLGAQYSSAPLAALLEERLGATTTLGALPRRVLVPAFNLDNLGAHGRPRSWAAKFFHNFPGPDSDGAELAVDVALRSSAAPTFFPPYQGYIDGGVVVNNPSMAALVQALDRDTGGQRLEDVRLLSVSAGFSSQFVPELRAESGVLWWARSLVELMVNGAGDIADYECAHLLGDQYHRLTGSLPSDIGLADVDALGTLGERAHEVSLEPALDWLEEHFWSGTDSRAPGRRPASDDALAAH